MTNLVSRYNEKSELDAMVAALAELVNENVGDAVKNMFMDSKHGILTVTFARGIRDGDDVSLAVAGVLAENFEGIVQFDVDGDEEHDMYLTTGTFEDHQQDYLKQFE